MKKAGKIKPTFFNYTKRSFSKLLTTERSFSIINLKLNQIIYYIKVLMLQYGGVVVWPAVKLQLRVSV